MKEGCKGGIHLPRQLRRSPHPDRNVCGLALQRGDHRHWYLIAWGEGTRRYRPDRDLMLKEVSE